MSSSSPNTNRLYKSGLSANWAASDWRAKRSFRDEGGPACASACSSHSSVNVRVSSDIVGPCTCAVTDIGDCGAEVRVSDEVSFLPKVGGALRGTTGFDSEGGAVTDAASTTGGTVMTIGSGIGTDAGTGPGGDDFGDEW